MNGSGMSDRWLLPIRKIRYLWACYFIGSMRRLYEYLEQDARNTEWGGWLGEVLSEARQVNMARAETWAALESLSKNVVAMRWLVEHIRKYNPLPPENPEKESALYLLAAYCPDNCVLGYVVDTYMYYYRTGNPLGVLSCIRIQSLVNRCDEYPHLNALYNIMMNHMLGELRLHITPPRRRCASSFLTGRDFRAAERLLPDFRHLGFRERLLAAQAQIDGVATGEDLARELCMSVSVFRKRFKQEFGMHVSEWLRLQRKENIKRMLDDGSIPLCRVAESNGFNMLSTFSDYCRRNFGKSPRQMREKTCGE